MVNVTHDTDDGRAGFKRFRRILVLITEELFFNGDDDFLGNLRAERFGDKRRGIEVDDLVERRHHAELNELFDNRSRRDLESLCKLADLNLVGNLHVQLLTDDRLLALPSALIVLAVLVVVADVFMEPLASSAQIAHAVADEGVELLIVLGKIDGVRASAGIDHTGRAAFDGSRGRARG